MPSCFLEIACNNVYGSRNYAERRNFAVTIGAGMATILGNTQVFWVSVLFFGLGYGIVARDPGKNHGPSCSIDHGGDLAHALLQCWHMGISLAMEIEHLRGPAGRVHHVHGQLDVDGQVLVQAVAQHPVDFIWRGVRAGELRRVHGYSGENLQLHLVAGVGMVHVGPGETLRGMRRATDKDYRRALGIASGSGIEDAQASDAIGQLLPSPCRSASWPH